MIERNIDYIQYSAKISEMEFIEAKLPEIPPVKFYQRGYRDVDGTRYYFGNPNSEAALVVMSSEPINYRLSQGEINQSIIESCLRDNGKVSRLDLAVTEYVDENLFLVSDVVEWYEQGKVNSSLAVTGAKAISNLMVDPENRVETFYIGDIKKRAKRGIFRAYDKGVELGIGKYLISRIEIEDRRDKAHISALRLAEGASVASVFRSRFDVQDKEFERLMDSETANFERLRPPSATEDDEKNDSRWTWLMKQVAPSLKEAIEYDLKRGKGKSRLQSFLAKSGITKQGVL